MLELSAITSIQPGCPCHLISFRLNPILFSNLKDLISAFIANLAELKVCIEQYILKVTLKTLRLVLRHALSRFQLVAESGGQHVEHVLRQFHKI